MPYAAPLEFTAAPARATLAAGARGRLPAGTFLRAAQTATDRRAVPFLHLRRTAHGIVADGDTTFETGHRIAVPGRHPEGVFLSWRWADGVLTIERDAYGLLPCFVWQHEGGIALSTSLARLLALGAPAEYDVPGVAAFLALGWYLGDDTPFRAIRNLPPAPRLVWRGDGLAAEGAIGLPGQANLTREAAIDAYIDLFRAAMLRRPPQGRIIASLSGGRDSRHILLEMCRAGWRPDEVVTGELPAAKASNDLPITRQLCERLGLPHRIVQAPASRFRAELRKNDLTQFNALEHAWYLPCATYLAARAGSLYDGLAGDVLSAGRILADEDLNAMALAGDFDTLAARIVGNGHRPMFAPQRLRDLLGGRLPWKDMGPLATQRLAADLRRFAGTHRPLTLFRFWSRTRRCVSLMPLAMAGRGPVTYCPFLDREVFDFLMALPHALTVGESFHDAAIHRAFPAMADIPFSSTPVAVRRRSAGTRRFAAETLLHMARHGTSPNLDGAWLAKRLAGMVLHGWTWAEQGYALPHAIYLMQLHDLASGQVAA